MQNADVGAFLRTPQDLSELPSFRILPQLLHKGAKIHRLTHHSGTLQLTLAAIAKNYEFGAKQFWGVRKSAPMPEFAYL